MSTDRQQFNVRLRHATIALLRTGAADRGISLTEELERIVQAAYLNPPPSASAPLARAALAPGQRLAIDLDNNGIVSGTVIDIDAAAAALSAVGQAAEPRTPYCEPESQEHWGQ